MIEQPFFVEEYRELREQVRWCVHGLCAETCNELTYSCQQFHGIGGGTTEVTLEEIAKRWDDMPYWQ